MTKILKPYTIIPPELYVQRDADRQIKFILNDMGRPGYVLVSRQMGKTNLLLNAKRRLETPEDIFVYVDLSNPFTNAKTCFENIINSAIDTNPERLLEVSEIINDRRKDIRDTPPHKQHINELRLILNAIKGKLVIILDEIDVLTKTPYSDQIFAQIRSIYFSRINYKELERLTYILSGVVEPTDIIKDPKISPFNIGQKIFLNDFNRAEFEQFLDNSKMNLGSAIKERIFYWTAGNPRMTWDICSDVENLLLQDQNITLDIVDKIVNDLYLITYDKPPIDNIRELVKKDTEIRNAIVEIGYQKGKEVSDKIKSKLYLTGITNYSEKDNDIHIKNRIIEKSLNIEWIKDLEEQDKGLIKIALEKFEKEDFNESFNIFERYLKQNEFEESEKPVYYYYMGSAAYRISKFKEALHYINKSSFDPEEDSKWFFKVLNLKGLIYFYLNQVDESLSCFHEVLKADRKDDNYVRALLNYGSIASTSDKSEYEFEASRIFNEIINETGFNKDKLKEDLIFELKSVAHYNLAQNYSLKKESEKAIIHYNQALEYCKETVRPKIIIKLLKVSKDDTKNNLLLEELIRLIVDKNIKPNSKDPDKPLEYSFDDLNNLLIHTFIYRFDLFENLTPSLNVFGEKEISEHLYDLALFSINENNDWSKALKILEYLYSKLSAENFKISDEIKYQILKLLAFSSRPKESTKIHLEYISIFEKVQLSPIDYLDFEIFANLVFTLVERHKYSEALKYVYIINSVKTHVSENLLINYLVIGHLELNIYFYLNERIKAIGKAKEILRLAEDEEIKLQKSNLLGDTGLEIIKQNAESILRPTARVQSPIRRSKSYGRNEIIKVRYKDGTIIETKFKKVETDLKNEECFILN
jgi:tetratricopeptide (TPR) repeat protein